MNAEERLGAYRAFDDEIIEQVAEAASLQNRLSFPELADYYNVSGGASVVPETKDYKAFEFVRFIPAQDYDNAKARLLHASMATPADESMAMRAMRLFQADSSQQLIVLGNPAYAGRSTGKIRPQDLLKVACGDLASTVNGPLQYFAELGITSLDNIGYSYGADKAATASARAADYDMTSARGIFMESAASIKRNPPRLLVDFASSGAELDNYVASAGSQPLDEARTLADKGLTRYILGLARASNLALGSALAKPLFERRVASALATQPDLRVAVAWGTSSELSADSATMAAMCERLRSSNSIRRKVAELAIRGMYHAGGDDIDLHAAIVLQGYKATS